MEFAADTAQRVLGSIDPQRARETGYVVVALFAVHLVFRFLGARYPMYDASKYRQRLLHFSARELRRFGSSLSSAEQAMAVQEAAAAAKSKDAQEEVSEVEAVEKDSPSTASSAKRRGRARSRTPVRPSKGKSKAKQLPAAKSTGRAKANRSSKRAIVEEVSTFAPQRNRRIVVAGGSGRVGSEVARCLVSEGYHVVIVDKQAEPLWHRRVEQAEYVELDVIECGEAALLEALEGADGVVNCVGTVALFDDPVTLHNCFVYGTAKLLWAVREVGVPCFVQTSSTVVVHNGASNINAVPSDAPYIEEHVHAGAKYQIEAEKIVLDVARRSGSVFRACVVRIPGVYGFLDGTLFTQIVEKQLLIFPSCTDVRAEVLYVKNAGHGLYCAIRTLLGDERESRLASGKAFTITQSDEGEILSIHEFWQKARHAMGVGRPFIIVPVWFVYLLAFVVELVYDFCAGVVPNQEAYIWHFSRPFLGYVVHDNTFLGQREAWQYLGYKPVYNTEESFQDIAEMHREAAEDGAAEAGAGASKSVRQATIEQYLKTSWFTGAPSIIEYAGRDPLEDVDWEPRPLSSRNILVQAFESLVGPGLSLHESVLSCAMAGLAVAFSEATLARAPGRSWTATQRLVAYACAGFNIVGAVQTTSATSKRWFHLNGQLPTSLFIIMLIDGVLQCLVLGSFFGDSPEQVSEFQLRGSAAIVAGLVVLRAVPLRVQRMYGAIIFLAMCAAHELGVVFPQLAGLAWVLPLISFKLHVSHCPRAEPYRG